MDTNKTGDGYWVIEPPDLEPYWVQPQCLELAVLILHWIATEANARLAGRTATVSVIRVEYMGAYPAFGVQGVTERDRDIELMLFRLASEMLHTKTVGELLAYAKGMNLRELTRSVMGEDK